ncbi:Alternative NAD(P)H dehydrogenase 1, mitochondrial [Dendrobium catenatum]|uniref:Alternative NAD(P)H dehydrogenase 1, mitochondrial n=1 Tax=Dendrobium catenatum TaxID=906689 RepID=A0A2I0WVI7_9ASPA|nr:Alternative NAD(P)H dehydrogenase 1, mitochondrial [Dendrobium catenatum]
MYFPFLTLLFELGGKVSNLCWLKQFFFVCLGMCFKVHCETVTDGTISASLEPWKFQVSYDKLVIALGAEASTFGINGVKEHATFLREVHHAQEIRRKLLLNLMLSDLPGALSQRYGLFYVLYCSTR